MCKEITFIFHPKNIHSDTFTFRNWNHDLCVASTLCYYFSNRDAVHAVTHTCACISNNKNTFASDY